MYSENITAVCEFHNCGLSATTYFKSTKRWCCQSNAGRCPAVIKNRAETCLEKYGSKNVSSVKEINDKRNNTFDLRYGKHPLKCDNIIQKRKDALIEKFGVDNYGKTQDHKDTQAEYYNLLSEDVLNERVDRIIQTKLKSGLITDPELRPEFEKYYIDVRHLSDRNYKKYKKIINPDNFSRGRTSYHLDHIFSIKDAFENNVPVEVVSHRSNLRMMKYDENIAKGGLSEKSLNSLFEDFYRNE